MNSPETLFANPEKALDRDAIVHYEAVFKIAHNLALEERSEGAAKESPRFYLYALIDFAAEAGYVIDNLEAIDLLERARDKIHQEDRFQFKVKNGLWNWWDEDPTAQYEEEINYDESSAEVNTGEHDE